MRIARVVVAFLLAGLVPFAAVAQELPNLSLDPDKASRQGSPLDHLPPHIQLLDITLPEGAAQRADWSPDSERLIFLDGPVGNVWEYELETGDLREVSSSVLAGGVLRAHHLSNGDLLACVAADPGGEDARFNGFLWVLPSPLGERPAVALGEACWEGITTSKAPGSTRIAWNQSTVDFSDLVSLPIEATLGESKVFTGRVVYDESGTPSLVDRREVLDKSDVSLITPAVEAQDFRRLDDGDEDPDDELVFSAYVHGGGQAMSVNLDTGEVTDWSPQSPFYEEAEGIDPGGEWVLVERDLILHAYPDQLDIWRLPLDGSGAFERLTTFDHFEGHGASNPVVAPDRSRFAFQLKKSDSEHGEGHGLLLFDLAAYDQLPESERPASPPGVVEDPDNDGLPATGDAGQIAMALTMLMFASRSRRGPRPRRPH